MDTFDLQRDDDDAERRWSGVVRGAVGAATAASGPTSSLAMTSPVADLQRDLRGVGILLGPEPSGTFDVATEWAVREFQCYARMTTVAVEGPPGSAPEYVDRLSPVATGTHRYAGPVSGVANAATRAALAHWIGARWRVPVVLDVWDMKASPPVLVARNVWLRTDDRVKQHAVRARDLSGHHRPQGPTERWNAGTSMPYDGSRGAVVPPTLGEKESEVLPETLLGTPWAQLGAAQRSTFKVIRSVTEVECYGFMDNVNGYDGGVVSAGIFHFIVGREGTGELAGALHRLAGTHASDYERFVRSFGVDVTPPRRKHPRFKLSDESGAYPEPPPTVDGLGAHAREQIEYLRSWHWFYRFVMLSRTWQGFRELQWTLAHERLRRILGRPIDPTVLPPVDPTVDPPVLARIGDVFTSELSVGYLLRWDVNRPKQITDGSLRVGARTIPAAGSKVIEIIEEAKRAQPQLAWAARPSTWTDLEEAALHDAVDAVPKLKELRATLPRIASFPNVAAYWSMDRTVVTALSRKRGSFLLSP